MCWKRDPSVQMLRGGSPEVETTGVCLGYRAAVFGGIKAVSLLWNLKSVLATGTCYKSMSQTPEPLSDFTTMIPPLCLCAQGAVYHDVPTRAKPVAEPCSWTCRHMSQMFVWLPSFLVFTQILFVRVGGGLMLSAR